MAADVHRTPDERFAALPGFPYEPRYADQDGLRMHYVDEGDGDPILLLHGEPTWSFLWRKLIPTLAERGRCIAPDLFGFGRSDKPLAREWYSYDAHAASIARLVEQLELERITLVVHDWGGPIGLRLAVEHAPRVRRLVVLNTAIGAGRAPSEAWLRFRAVVRELGDRVDLARIVQAGCATELPDQVVAAYEAPFGTPESKVGALMFPELVPTEPEHPTAPAMLRVQEALASLDVPALVLWGERDPVLGVGHARRFAELLPGALPPETIPDAAHFLQEDAGERVAERIAVFLRE